MSPTDAIALLAPAFSNQEARGASPTSWADLGSGSGVFTLALAALLYPGSVVHAVDRHRGIRALTTANNVIIQPYKADFVRERLPFHRMDGIIMANSLHSVKDKPTLIHRLREEPLRSEHEFLIVEYDTDRPTPVWVPYPVSFSSLRPLFQLLGYRDITRLADRPSVYNRNPIYSARIAW